MDRVTLTMRDWTASFLSLRAYVLLVALVGSIGSSHALTLASWNIEWLSSDPSDRFEASLRSAQDFDALGRYFAQIDPDVLAFQEVNDEQALRNVVGSGYQIWLSDRSLERHQDAQFGAINQYTGFAVRAGIEVVQRDDIILVDQARSRLRFAAYLVLNPQGHQPLHLLSVHLKAGCSGAYRDNRDCRLLYTQGESLNAWISEREANQEAYLIMGDFNHNLAFKGDWLWRTLTEGTKAQLASDRTAAQCVVRSNKQANKTHKFRSLIDHVIASPSLTLATPYQVTYETSDLFQYRLSDHCPMVTRIID